MQGPELNISHGKNFTLYLPAPAATAENLGCEIRQLKVTLTGPDDRHVVAPGWESTDGGTTWRPIIDRGLAALDNNDLGKPIADFEVEE